MDSSPKNIIFYNQLKKNQNCNKFYISDNFTWKENKDQRNKFEINFYRAITKKEKKKICTTETRLSQNFSQSLRKKKYSIIPL